MSMHLFGLKMHTIVYKNYLNVLIELLPNPGLT